MENYKKENPENSSKYKILMLGEQAVGKSSLVLRYTNNIFKYNIMGTAGLDLKKKDLKINDENITLLIYDSAGHDRFRKITEMQYKGSDGLILVYDTTDTKSFDWISEWIDKIKSPELDSEILLLGNKIDLPNRLINLEKAEELTKKYNISYIETSALTGENVDLAFSKLIEKIHIKKGICEKNKKIYNGYNFNIEYQENLVTENKIQLNKNQNIKEKKKKGCCK